MEDYITVNFSPNDDLIEIPELKEQAFVGVFDGHGGKGYKMRHSLIAVCITNNAVYALDY